jgi:hypothetical protein
MSVAEQIASGIAFAVAAILAVAGVLKLAGPETLVTSLDRLLPGRSWYARAARTKRAVRGLGVAEIGLGAALAMVRGWPGVAVAAAVVALTVGFVLVVRRAIRLGVSCGCFGRLGQTSAGGRELGRAVSVAAAAAAVLLFQLATVGSPLSVGVASLVAAAGTFGCVALGMEVGERMSGKVQLRSAPSHRSRETTRFSRIRSRLGEALGLDNGVFAARGSSAPPAAATRKGIPLGGSALASAVSALRASENLPVLLAHLEEVGCSVPNWELSSASQFAATTTRPVSVFIQVPLEPGCVMLASIEGDERPRGLVGCHASRCAGVVDGKLTVPS